MSKMDRDVQRILMSLDADKKSTTNIRNELDYNQNQQVLYRFENKVPDEYVEQVESEEHAGRDVLVWRLTDKGQQWVNEHRDEIRGPQTLTETINELQKIRDKRDKELRNVRDELDKELESLRKGLTRVEGRWGSVQYEVTQLREQVKQIESNLADSERALTQDIKKSEKKATDRLDDFSEQTESLSDSLESLEKDLRGKAERRQLTEVKKQQLTLLQRLDGVENELEELNETLKKHAEMYSVFDEVNLTGIKNRLEKVEDIEDLEERIENVQDTRTVERAEEAIKDLEERNEKFAKLEESVDNIEENIENIEYWIGDNEISSGDDVEDYLKEESEKIEELESNGFWSIL